MKIAVLTHNFFTNKRERKNAGVFIYDFVQALSEEKKWKVLVFFFDFEGKQRNMSKDGVTIFTPKNALKKLGTWSIFSPLSIYYFLQTMREIKKLTELFVKKRKISFMLACWALPAGLIAYHIKKRLHIPYAVWCLGSDINIFARIPFLKTMIIQSLNEASIIFVNSNHLGKRVKHLTGRDSIFLPAVTEFNDKKTLHIKKREKMYYLLYVGRFEKIKGVDILLHALTFINTNKYNVVLWLGGDGSLAKSMQKFIDQKGLVNKVFLLGTLNRDQIIAYMNSADLLIVPSRNESLPLVLIEAGKLGLPIVATNVGDNKRFIKQYGAGIIAKPGSPRSLATGIKRGLDTLPSLKNQAKKKKRHINQLFTPQNSAKLFLHYATKIT